MTSSRTHARLGALTIALAIAWGVVALYALVGVLPHGALTLPAVARVRVVLPEGWAFFTRDPREPDVDVLALRKGEWVPALRRPFSAARNLFGLSRAGRAQAVELGMLMGELKTVPLTPCRAAPEQCAEALEIQATVANHEGRRTICGEVLVVVREPTPWAWSGVTPRVEMPTKIARVEVAC